VFAFFRELQLHPREDFFAFQRVDLVNSPHLQLFNAPAIVGGRSVIGIYNSAVIRIDEQHDGMIVFKQAPVTFLALM